MRCFKGPFGEEQTLAVLSDGTEGFQDERGGGKVPETVSKDCCIKGLGVAG